ncbi:MAG TPA: extracellular solute-binding protein [Chloroflexota bacterium]|nr:extracellular solute-binding protein [Chloroflexota bacterium]
MTTTATSRRRLLAGLAAAPAVLTGGALGACAMGATGSAPKNPAELTGTFEFFVQNFAPTVAIHEQSIAAFKEVAPNAKLVLSQVAFGDMAAKATAIAAAGGGADGIHTYSDMWRGIDASQVMLPLTPNLMSRKEAEKIAVPTMLDSVWSRKKEVYLIPQAVGVNGSHYQYNADHLRAGGIEPKSLTTLDGVVEAGVKLTKREGADVTRAGLLPTEGTTAVYSWIVDQGGKFYDETTNKWSWQTAEAERAFKYLLDLYDRHRVAWRTAPPGTTSAMGQGLASAQMVGPYSISGLWVSNPDVKLLDQPMPGFVNGKAPNYYLVGFSGMALSSTVKPDSPAARIGAAYYKFVYSAEQRIKTQANEYSGAILNYDVYSNPAFKQTKFAELRTDFVEKVIKRMFLPAPAASPGVAAQWTKVLQGQLNIQAMLAELQQVHQTAEDEALRGRK